MSFLYFSLYLRLAKQWKISNYKIKTVTSCTFSKNKCIYLFWIYRKFHTWCGILPILVEHQKHFRIFSCEWAFYNAKSSKTFFTITLFEPSHSLNYTINLPNLVNLIILGDNLDKTTIIKYLEVCKYTFCPLTFYLAAHRAASMQWTPPPPKKYF